MQQLNKCKALFISVFCLLTLTCIGHSQAVYGRLYGTVTDPSGAIVPNATVLVTNLYNRTQPPIRYELTDSFVREPDAPDHGFLRARVNGRADDILHYGGIDVHPHVVASVMVKAAAASAIDHLQAGDFVGVEKEQAAIGEDDGALR